MPNVNYGRFLYVDPNNIDIDNSPANMMPSPPEDYCISVNLTVKAKQRIACGNPNESYTLYFSSDNGTISFFGGSGGDQKSGKQGFLTTNWTDVSVDNIGSGNKECIGIDSIKISYDSWFFPMVSIRFVDVRGASLMLPQEAAFQKAVGDSSVITQMEGGSFFKSLFTFPYPEFILTVKGFYGKEVSYKLAVTGQNFEFNAKNGNFHCDVDFKGYMYGVYTDIPMTFIAIAPYYDKKNYWNSKVQDRTFQFQNTDGSYTDMVTFPELRAKITLATANLTQATAESVIGKQHASATETLTKLTEIRDSFPLTESDGWKVKEVNGKKRYYRFASGDGSFCSSPNGESILNFKSKVKGYDENNSSHYLTHISGLDGHITYWPENSEEKESPKLIADYCVNRNYEAKTKTYTYEIKKLKRNSETGVQEITSDKTLEEVYSDFKDFKDYCEADKTHNKFYLYFIDTDLIARIDNDRESAQQTEEKAVNELNKERVTQLRNLLGFDLTVENVFKLVFAHLDTFVYQYFKMLGEIESDMNGGNRSIQKFGGAGHLDINSNYKGGVPPFPLMVKEENVGREGEKNTSKQNVVQWPEDIINEEIPETKFIKDLLAGTRLYSNAEAEARANLDATIKKSATTQNFITDVSKFIPVTLFDLVRENANYNPYACLAKKISMPDVVINRAVTIFYLRAYYFFAMFDDLKSKSNAWKYFGKTEAQNFKSALDSVMNQDLINYISGYTKTDATDYVTTTGADKEWAIMQNKQINVPLKATDKQKDNLWNKVSYSWLSSADDTREYLPVGTYDFEEIKDDLTAEEKLQESGNYIILDKNTDVPIGKENKTFYRISEGTGFFEALKDQIGKVYGDEKHVGMKKVFKTMTDEYTDNPYGCSENSKKSVCFLLYKDSSRDSSAQPTGHCYINEAISNPSDEMGVGVVEYKKNSSYIITQSDTSYGNGSSPQYLYEKAIGSWGGEMDGSTPFLRPIFLIQNKANSEYARFNKAYLFLYSVPIRGQYHRDFVNASNCYVTKTEMLRNGAYLWRKSIMDSTKEDPIVYPKNYKKPTANEIPVRYIKKMKNILSCGITLSYLSVADKKDNDRYYTMDEYDGDDGKVSGFSDGKKERMIEFFKEWANSEEFGKILSKFDIAGTLVETNKINLDDYGVNQIVDFGNIEEITGKFFSTTAQQALVEIYRSKVTAIDCINVINEKSGGWFGIGRDSSKGIEIIENAFEEFLKFLRENLNSENYVLPSAQQQAMNEAVKSALFKDEDLRKSVYLNLKNLYDKWLCGFDKRKLELGNDECDFKDIKFIDSFYNNIGNRLLCNPTQIKELLGSVLPTEELQSSSEAKSPVYNGVSVYEFLSNVCQKNGMSFLSLPLMFGMSAKKADGSIDEDNIRDMFKAWSYPANIHYVEQKGNVGQTYVCLYTYKPSSTLDVRDDSGLFQYDDDSFDIGGTTVHPMPSTLLELGSADVIPAFGVSYGKGNQSFFKSISLSTKDQQVTEASIATTMEIASQGGDSPTETTFFGQDIYRVYANNSYSCTVEMMGNAQIMPLMYFQLNGIPMWRGAYMITKVEHEITAGNMTTKFTGTRQSKRAIPFAKGGLILVNDDGTTDVFGGTNGNNGRYDGNYSIENPEEWEKKMQELANEYTSNNKSEWYPEAKEVYFKMSNLIYSNTAKARKINNEATGHDLENLLRVQAAANSFREFYGKPINVNSGYRSPELNTAVRGAKSSSHCQGNAVDLRPKDYSDYENFKTACITWGKYNDFYQFIDEFDSKGSGLHWIHFQIANDNNPTKPRAFWYADKATGSKQIPDSPRITIPREGRP